MALLKAEQMMALVDQDYSIEQQKKKGLNG